MTHCLRCNDMSLLLFVESSHAFDGHVVCLRCSRCEHNIFRIGPNQVRNMLVKGTASKTLIILRDTLINIPCVHPPQLSLPPNHMRASDCEGFRTGL
jgi:hypothetical protein